MSTRGTIAYSEGRWHLYHDLADEAGPDGAVRLHLEIRGQPFEASNDRYGSVVTVALPADLAAALLRGLGKAGAEGGP